MAHNSKKAKTKDDMDVDEANQDNSSKESIIRMCASACEYWKWQAEEGSCLNLEYYKATS
eukprot:7031495-Ditylum_brightwellii.AAC.1